MTPDAQTAEPVRGAVSPEVPNGRHDHAQRRAAKRTGRERGCWLYIPAVQLLRAGYTADQPAPYYRVWGNARGRVTVQLYREP
jgi:hypothetical protein